jgi:ATP-binding cassette, subfamily A (ABC1), member 3
LSLQNALSSTSGRNIVALVNNGFHGGNIDNILGHIGDIARSAGKDVRNLENEDDLLTVCRSSLRGATNCFGALIFYSSPTEGEHGIWNYTLKVDGSLGSSIDVRNNKNDQEIFLLPMQHAVDYAIAGIDTPQVLEYPYTSATQEERNTNIRIRYMGALIDILGVAFFIGICPILYQQVGLQAIERELGISQLMESMMPNKARWQPQAARLAAYHIAFTIMFFPGWLIMAIILHIGVFARTSVAVVIFLHILEGLALASFSLFIGAFFRKAQLSGITAIIVSLVLAVIAQVFNLVGNGTVIACSLLFPSMNYTYFITLMARWEAQDIPTNLVEAAPDNTWTVSGIVLFILLIIQILVYPILAALVERYLWGTPARHEPPQEPGVALELTGFSKHYFPSLISKLPFFTKKETVYAANDINISILQGQLTVLVGANGCGKSTTLDAISGISHPTHGTIRVDTTRGIGLCPQKNVHWALLTVYEHVNIFNRLKSTSGVATKEQNLQLIRDCDLERKIHAKAKSLSGGQQRKLQLSIMFTGGSQFCLVDEVSSGIDPLARRRIQEILLAERSKRTIIFTSHFLDEADIADRVVIMSKGRVRVDGTGPQVKQAGVYRIHVHHGINNTQTPHFGIESERTVFHDQTVYTVSTAAEVTALLEKLEQQGWNEYHVSGPTIEDAFMKVAEEMVPEAKLSSNEKDSESESETNELQLQNGTHIGPFKQGFVLFRKRYTVFKRSFLPNTVAFLILPIAAGLVSLFVKNYPGAGCSPTDQVTQADATSLSDKIKDSLDIVLGPSGNFSFQTLQLVATSIGFGNTSSSGSSTGGDMGNLTNSLHFVDSLDSFNSYISQNYHNVTPGGAFFGNQTTIAFKANGAVALSFLVQNVANIIATNTSIAAQYSNFAIPWQADQGSTLQFCVYLGLALCVYPAFFSLYPTLERLRNVRNLHYSNGVRPLPLWLAYTIFDFLFTLAGSALAIIILAAVNLSIFFSIGHLFLVFILYGLTAALISYVVSLYARSQLAAFAVAAAYQAITLLLYMIAYLSVFTYGMCSSAPTLGL